ncbi:hypothetical protein EG103P3_00064 [Enterococcus phage EG103P3]|nr:hypothetical protein EG103P3_00064 [Enterococcus phage EG103P3]
MTKNQELFIKLWEESGQEFTDELLKLFDVILMEDFHDNPELMSKFMESIQKVPEPPLEQQVAMLQETVLQLSELIAGGM